MSDSIIYINGKWFPPSQAKVSVFDHGLLYGDGVFEGIRAYQGHAFRLSEHLKRLERSASLISLRIPLSLSQLNRIVYSALRKNKLKDAYIRLLVTRGAGDLGLDPRACPRPGVIVIADKLALFPARSYEEGLCAIIAKTRRNILQALDPSIKSMNYLNNIQAKIEANKKGVPEAIMLNMDGHVSECSGDNVFFIKKNVVVTPPVFAGVLIGITRAVVTEIVKREGRYRIREKLFYPKELFNADEVFFTGTAAEIIPVTRIDKRVIGTGRPGPITKQLIESFKTLVKKEAQIRHPGMTVMRL